MVWADPRRWSCSRDEGPGDLRSGWLTVVMAVLASAGSRRCRLPWSVGHALVAALRAGPARRAAPGCEALGGRRARRRVASIAAGSRQDGPARSVVGWLAIEGTGGHGQLHGWAGIPYTRCLEGGKDVIEKRAGQIKSL